MKSAKDVHELLTEISREETCVNGSVVFFLNKHKNEIKGRKKPIPYTSIAETLCEVFLKQKATAATIYFLKPKIQTTIDVYKKLTKTPDRNWVEIVNFLRTTFSLTSSSATSVSENGTNTGVENGYGIISSSPKSETAASSTPNVSPVKTRRDCGNCSSAKKVNLGLRENLKSHKGRIHKLNLSTAALKKKWNVKVMTQKIKRKEEKIESLKRDLRKCQVKLNFQSKKLSSSSSQLSKQMKENCQLRAELEQVKSDLKQSEVAHKRNNKNIEDGQKYAEFLTSLVEDKIKDGEGGEIMTKEGRTYNINIRRCIYNALLCDVPVKNCGVLIKTVVKILTDKSITVPCPSTCSQMAYELGILATIQNIEFMMDQKSLCLSWDATTVEGAHINEIHITANKTNCLVLDVQHLPGGKSCDYVAHIMGYLSEGASTYARFKGMNELDVFMALKSRIASTLTDRAVVNAAVTRQLCSELDADLLLLNCNVHPLDSVARDIKAVLNKSDVEQAVHGECYGSEGAAANLIKAVSVLRYKDGKGDPVGFKNFLRQQNISAGAFPRYVGNRLHVLFHLAGILILYEAQLRDFLEKQCTAGGLLRSRILKDLKNNKIMTQVWILAGIGKTFSGPWMSRFYSSTMSNLEMGPLIQRCVGELKDWIEDPQKFVHLHCDAFGETLDPSKDDVLAALHNFVVAEPSLLMETAKSVLSTILSVLSRQLEDFVRGKYSEPTAEMMELAASAPTHNMSSERTLGSFDRLLRRAPIATIGFLKGKVKTKFNKTLEWLENKTDGEKKSLINFVSGEARHDRCRKIVEQKELEAEISKRRGELEIQREKSKKNSIMRDLNKTLNKVKPLDSSYSGSIVNQILNYMDCPESVMGMLYLHSAAGGDQKYGRIQRVKKNHKFVVGFWNLEEMECTSTDFTISASSFFADLVIGNAVLM